MAGVVAEQKIKINTLQRQLTRGAANSAIPVAARVSGRHPPDVASQREALSLLSEHDVQEVLQRHEVSQVVFSNTSSSSQSPSNSSSEEIKVKFKKELCESVRLLGAQAVLIIIESLIPISFWMFVGLML